MQNALGSGVLRGMLVATAMGMLRGEARRMSGARDDKPGEAFPRDRLRYAYSSIRA
jgi:hypothetical protein